MAKPKVQLPQQRTLNGESTGRLLDTFNLSDVLTGYSFDWVADCRGRKCHAVANGLTKNSSNHGAHEETFTAAANLDSLAANRCAHAATELACCCLAPATRKMIDLNNSGPRLFETQVGNRIFPVHDNDCRRNGLEQEVKWGRNALIVLEVSVFLRGGRLDVRF